MIENWGNKIAQDIWERGASPKIPREIHLRARVLLNIMNSTDSLKDLRIKGEPPGLRLHQLKGERKGEWAMDIVNKTCPWRIVFKFKSGKFLDVKIEDYH